MVGHHDHHVGGDAQRRELRKGRRLKKGRRSMEGQSKRRHWDVDNFEEQAQEMEGGWCAPRGQDGGLLVEMWSKA